MFSPREDFVKVVPFHLSDRLVIVLCENKPEPQTLDGLVDFKVDKLIWIWMFGWVEIGELVFTISEFIAARSYCPE